MYREPKAAKRLYFDVIPRHVDEYLQFLDAYPRQADKERLGNPVWHIHSGKPPVPDNPVPFAMLLSLVTASNAANAETLWGFIGRYRPGVTPAAIRGSPPWSITPSIIIATLSRRRNNSASRMPPNAPH